MTARTLGIVSILLALALAVVVTLWILDGESPMSEEGAAPSAGAPADPRVLAALERIERALQRLAERSGRDVPDPAPGRESDVVRPEPARSEVEEPFPELQRLERRVQELHDVLDEHVTDSRSWRERNRSLGELKASEDGADWTALDELIAQWLRSKDEAKKAVQLLTFRDVLARYGTPTEIWRNEDGAHWVYQRGVDEVYLRFNDGFVTVLGVK